MNTVVMSDALIWPLRLAGVGLVVLAIVHVQISRHLKWREESERMSLTNASIFRVHTFFICVVLVMMGAPSLLSPHIFVQRTEAGLWATWSFATFWALRLIFQWFVYPSSLWRGKPFERAMHILFTLVWTALTVLYILCGLVQLGRFS